MKIKMLLITLLLLVTTSHSCKTNYQYINGKKMMSNCAWNEYLENKRTSHPHTTKYDFTRTFRVESYNRYDAVNRNDVGSGMSLGRVQFNGTHARKLAKTLGIKPWMKTREIKRRLRTAKSKKLQNKMFRQLYVRPVLKFANRKRITNRKVVECLVDWRVNGMPKKYYRKVTRYTTLEQLVDMRKGYYTYLHKRKPRRYTKRILKHWLHRANSFLS